MFMNELFECFSKHCIRNAWFRSYSRQNLFREIDTFLKNFVKLTFSAKKLVLHSVKKYYKMRSRSKIPWNQLFSNLLYIYNLTEKTVIAFLTTFPHCVLSQCGNYGNSPSRIFDKNFVKVTVLLSKLPKSWFDKIFLWWERISRFSTLCPIDCDCCRQFFVNLTNFLQNLMKSFALFCSKSKISRE